MTSSIGTDAPKCPHCNAPMRVKRVLPTVLPKECGTETRVFECTGRGTTLTRTLHSTDA
jgi:hypothetical protein